MFPLRLWPVILRQHRFQFLGLPGRNRWACPQFPLVADYVLGIAFVASHGGDRVEFSGALLTVLTRSDGDSFHGR